MQQLNVFADNDVDAAAEAVSDVCSPSLFDLFLQLCFIEFC